MLAEGRIRWAFWPPGTSLDLIQAHQESGAGIWLPRPTEDDYDASSSEDEAPRGAGIAESDDEDAHATSHLDTSDAESAHEDTDEDESDEREEAFVPRGTSRFAALQLAGDDSDSDSEND
jgi:hypothetical protein